MIFFDRIARFFKKDIYLPNRCNAKEYNIYFKRHKCCDCKNFCKYPKQNTPATIKIQTKNNY